MAKKNRNPVAETDEANEPGKETREKKRENDAHRREALKVVVAAGIGICALGTPIGAAARLILAPVFQKGRTPRFYPVAELNSLTETPRLFDIVDEKRDAWINIPEQKLGSLFLRKTEDRVVALQSACPRTGCTVRLGIKRNPQTGNDEELLYCPCHGARFDLDGHRLDNATPRDLDSLEIHVEDGVVFVRFEDFIFGIAEKRGR